MTSVLSEWRERLGAMSDCPWPGARPITLRPHGIGALHRRNPDVRLIIRKIEDSDVVVVTGESGVGKSSLLSVGVVPQLEQRGFLVIPCDDWSSVEHLTEDASDGRRLVQAALLRQIPFTITPKDDFTETMRELDDRYPGRVVIVLDQFEEVLRYEPAVAHEVLEWVQDLIASSSARVLLSLRAEYGYHVLGGLRLGAARLQHIQVDALTDEDIAIAIVTRGAPEAHESFISRPAVEAITSAWTLASHYDVGLLHLQALMWSLWMTKQGNRIELTDVRTLVPEAQDAKIVGAAFSRALAVSVQISLDQCHDAGGPAPGSPDRTVDAVVESRAAGSIAGMILHLSNDGYKVNRERDVLARLALFSADHQEWEAPLIGAEDALAKLRSRVDAAGDDGWLSLDRFELLPRAALVWPWDLDPREQTAGPLIGARPEDAIFESFRAYYFGLEWLRACSIVRISRTSRSRVMVSLVHDGFAEGLNRWRQGHRLGLGELTTRLVATKGQSFAWPTRPEQVPARPSIHSNLRIQHSEITGRIIDTIFANCDFKGTLFQDCTLEGVTFVNCILDDVQFTRCAIVGTPTRFDVEPDISDTHSLPGYLIPATAPHVRSIAWYRGMSVAALELHSATAGLPALPVENSSHVGAATALATAGAGLSILGGRISSLKFRQCEFFDDGGILMSQAAGTSVEFADQHQLRLQCDAVTLRGLTFTTPLEPLKPLTLPPNELGRRPKRGIDQFELHFDHALLSNIWFSQDMRGRVTFANCLVWQLFNAGNHGLVIDFSDDTGFVGLINVAGARDGLDVPSQDGLGTAAEQVDFARRRIDYRAHPTADEMLELTSTIRLVTPSFFPPDSPDDV